MKNIFLFLLLFCATPLWARDFVSTYHTDKWEMELEAWVEDYRKQYSTPLAFADAFVPEVKKEIINLLSKGYKDIATKLVCDLVEMIDHKGLSVVNESIAGYLYGLDIEVGEPSVLAERLLRMVKMFDKPALGIQGLEQSVLKQGRLIIFFYNTHCRNCVYQLNEMIKNYPLLQKKGYDIVTISADEDKSVYEEKVKFFPWKRNLCDFESYDGINFVQYGVASTPSLFLIDKEGILRLKTNRFDEILVKIE